MLKTACAMGVAAARRKLAAQAPGEDHPYVPQHRDDTIADNAAMTAIPTAILGAMGGNRLGSRFGDNGALVGALLGGGLAGYGGYRFGASRGEDIHSAAVAEVLRDPQSARRAVEEGLGPAAYGRTALHTLLGAGLSYAPETGNGLTRALVGGGIHGTVSHIREHEALERKRRLVEALVGLKEQQSD